MASRNVTAISKKLAGLVIALLIFPFVSLIITVRKGQEYDN